MSEHFKSTAALMLCFVSLLWAIELVNILLGHRLNFLGLWPRSVHGLLGIPLSPFLHAGVSHIVLNTVPLAVLGGLVAWHSHKEFVVVSLFIILVSGGGLWLFGRASYHVGASGLIFGYFGYLVARGWYIQSDGGDKECH
jgi:membrane associated rhomboid family serine protease